MLWGTICRAIPLLGSRPTVWRCAWGLDDNPFLLHVAVIRMARLLARWFDVSMPAAASALAEPEKMERMRIMTAVARMFRQARLRVGCARPWGGNAAAAGGSRNPGFGAARNIFAPHLRVAIAGARA
jgi:hypothetical protein